MDRYYSSRSTNAEHPSIYRSLCRMAMSLPVICRSRSMTYLFTFTSFDPFLSELYRRPILSLASMILDPERYEPDRFDMGNVAHVTRWDNMRLEMEADQRCATEVMEIVLKTCGLTLQDAQKELEDAHAKEEKWVDATDETIDVSYLYGHQFE